MTILVSTISPFPEASGVSGSKIISTELDVTFKIKAAIRNNKNL